MVVLAAGVAAAPASTATAPATAPRLGTPTSWGYQLQGIRGAPLDLRGLARSPHDLLVIDASDGDAPFTAAQIEPLKTRPDGRRRRVIAYLSIGEAESYRPYFQAAWATKPPPFLAAGNKEWHGNFKVRYWQAAWKAIVLASVDELIAAGFDGAYLDVIDAFEYFGPGGEAPERPSAATDMAELVIAIAQHARTTRARPGFAIVPQNGATLIDAVPAELARRYLDAIDGIGAEDTFYFGARPENNPLAIQRETVAALRRFVAAGKIVLAVDYVTSPARAKNFVKLARKEGFVPYVGRRALDRLVKQPRQEPPR